MFTLETLFAIIFGIFCVIFDVKYQRIPNYLLLIGLSSKIILYFIHPSENALNFKVIIVICAIVFIYLLKPEIMGGGDVKMIILILLIESSNPVSFFLYTCFWKIPDLIQMILFLEFCVGFFFIYKKKKKVGSLKKARMIIFTPYIFICYILSKIC